MFSLQEARLLLPRPSGGGDYMRESAQNVLFQIKGERVRHVKFTI